LIAQARTLGAGRLQLSRLALREAKIGVLAAVIAAFGAAISEVGAVIIVGGNFEGRDQTLASALLAQFNYYGNVPAMIAIGIVLLAAILVLMGLLTVLQQRGGGIHLRFRTA
jgi:tungstate transport system permease protein